MEKDAGGICSNVDAARDDEKWIKMATCWPLAIHAIHTQKCNHGASARTVQYSTVV